MKARYDTLGYKEFHDTITDINLISNENKRSNKGDAALDMLAVGLRDAGIIGLLKYKSGSDNFEFQAKITLGLDEGRVLVCYDKLFSFEDKLLFGFSKVGHMEVWDIQNKEQISKVTLSYKALEMVDQNDVNNTTNEEELSEVNDEQINVDMQIEQPETKNTTTNKLSSLFSVFRNMFQGHSEENNGPPLPNSQEESKKLGESVKSEEIREGSMEIENKAEEPTKQYTEPSYKYSEIEKNLEINKHLGFNNNVSFAVLPAINKTSVSHQNPLQDREII